MAWDKLKPSDLYEKAKEMCSVGLGDFLKQEYRISPESFSGTGYTVYGSGAGRAFSADKLLRNTIVPSYLVQNVSLVERDCKCLIVSPYTSQQGKLFSMDAFAEAEIGSCAKLEDF